VTPKRGRSLAVVEVAPEIRRAVAQLEPGGELVGLQTLTGGVSANVLGLEIATAAGGTRRVVFRQHRTGTFKQHGQTATAREYGVLAALHGAGLAVPEPYSYEDSEAVTARYLIIEWVGGSTELHPDDVPAALDQMARFLVGLHSLDPSALPLPVLEPIEDPLVAVIPYLRATEAGHRASAVLGTVALEPGVDRCVLLHGDYWPGNVIWQDGRLVAVIDWEDARLGDPLADLATARVELLCRYGDEAMEQFTTLYLAAYHDAVGPLPLESLAVWELYVSGAALATMTEWGLEPHEEAQRRRRTERFFEVAVRQLGRH
jgi:aminoglycoside phosphotransferase (APT) family kinase protein